MYQLEESKPLETIDESEEDLGSRGIGDGADVSALLSMVNFEDADLYESFSNDHILEAPEEFRSKDKEAEGCGIVSDVEPDRDQNNAQEVPCGRTEEAIPECQRDRVKDSLSTQTTEGVDDIAMTIDSSEGQTFNNTGALNGDDDEREAPLEDDGRVEEEEANGDVDKATGSATPSGMNEPRVSSNGEYGITCVLRETDDTPSIVGDGVAICATAPGCSRVSDAPASVTVRTEDPDDHLEDSESDPNCQNNSECAKSTVQDESECCECSCTYEPNEFTLRFIEAKNQINKLKEDVELIKFPERKTLLSSKELNKRSVDGRLKHLEEKLKAAGLAVDLGDEENKKQVVDDYDANQNLVLCNKDQLIHCEFDVAKYDDGSYEGYGGFFAVYDELDETAVVNENNEESPVNENMVGTDGERKQHNPDRDNLKSLLKKPGRGTRDHKKNRVVFKEDRNEFFDADYIILIREDCDYDEEEDDGICTCNQHEMVRLTCCEPNCNCNGYGGYDPTPQSPKFAPPLEFVDAVTLSPPEGYKDMELGEQQLLALQQMARRSQMAAVCRECSQTHDDEGEFSDEEQQSDIETEKTDHSQQTTPTTPPPADSAEVPGCMNESVTMPTANKRMSREEERNEMNESPTPSVPPGGSPISGILKGGRLWKQQSVDVPPSKAQVEQQQQQQQQQMITADNIASSDDENGKRSVRFIESDKRDSCDGAPEVGRGDIKESASPEPTEMTLTFKLGSHIMISNNSLKPNSAVRQLFPCTKPSGLKPCEKVEESAQQYLVTSESLRAFEEAKKLKRPLTEADESIKKAIERNSLRRSLIRYGEPRKKAEKKTDNSLVERIKQLTCDVDDPVEEQSRASPPGEEARNSPEVATLKVVTDKSFSPSSSSSSNSSVSSTYKKITDLFAKREKPDIQVVEASNLKVQAPDLGGPQEYIEAHNPVIKLNSTNAAENRKQFLATLGPLTACVGGTVQVEDYYYHTQGDRMSMASSVGTEYSLEDIEEGLKKDEDEAKKTPPDVLAGTPSASEAGDELAAFVQQDASRIERIKKKYQQDDEEDEHDDYGFNRRPSVRGIKPRFGSTTEILQQIQQQMQPPVNNTSSKTAPPVSWPYYSETNLSGVDNKKNVNNQGPNYQYAQYRPTTLMEENAYQQQQQQQQRCSQMSTYRSNMNVYTSSPIMRVGGGCNDYYQSSLSKNRNGRPQSPPPQEVTKGFHQMMYIPYNHIEGYQPGYYEATTYTRVSNQNQINKRYADQSNYAEIYAGKPVRPQYVIARSESPAYNNTARSTQTSCTVAAATAYYPRYRHPNGVVWTDGVYKPRYAPRYAGDNVSLTDSESQHSAGQLSNGHFKDAGGSITNSPTKPRFIERGVPEGAASVSPQDGQTSMTSPTSPQNPQTAAPTQKPLFYAMNV